MSTSKAKRGRRPVAESVASVSLALDAAHLATADDLAVDMGKLMAGLKLTRMDVLRTAIARGLTSMREEVDARLSPAGLAKH